MFAPLQTGMRSYFNGGGTPTSSSATPPPSMSSGPVGGRRSSSYLPAGGRSSSASLPRSPDNDITSHIASQSSSHDVYVNIYQNTNHPALFVSFLFQIKTIRTRVFPKFFTTFVYLTVFLRVCMRLPVYCFYAFAKQTQFIIADLLLLLKHYSVRFLIDV